MPLVLDLLYQIRNEIEFLILQDIPAYRDTVFSDVRPAHQNTCCRINHNPLIAAETIQRVDDPMAHLAQLAADGLTECGLQRQTFAEMAEAGGLARLLRIHTEIDNVHQNLRMTLWLHIATHHSE